MSAITEALSEPNATGGTGLKLPAVLAKMPDDLRDAAVKLLASERSDRAVSDAFTDDGYPVSQNAVRNYRRTNRLHRFTPPTPPVEVEAPALEAGS